MSQPRNLAALPDVTNFTAPRPRDLVPEISVGGRTGRWDGPAPPRRTVSASDIFPARQAIPLTEVTSRALDTTRTIAQEAKQDAEREKSRKWPNEPGYDDSTSPSKPRDKKAVSETDDAELRARRRRNMVTEHALDTAKQYPVRRGRPY